MSRYALIDVGSNTIRLCVYEVSNSKNGTMPRISTLLNHKAMAGLASYIQDGAMTPEGVKKATSTIGDHLENAFYFDCKEVRVFATACLRNCSNSAEVVAQIEKGIGAEIDLLPGEMEAHLGFRGASSDTEMDAGLLVDIGGGSVELTRIQDGKESFGVSVPQGSLSSFSQYVHGLVPTPTEMGRISQAFRDNLADQGEIDLQAGVLYGIGGSVRSAMKVYGDIFCGGVRLGFLEPVHIERMLGEYCDDGAAFAHGALHTVPDRVHTFVPGCLILRELFAVTGARRLMVAKRGLREGYLLERILGC